MSETTLTIGLPAGSLADATRGGSLIALLKNAGFPTKGYDKGGPSSFPLQPYFVGWDGRPQEFGSQLGLGEVDIAIAGDDWIQERRLELKYEYGQELEMERVMSLKRGNVRLVIIKNPDDAFENCDAWLKDLLGRKALVTMVSEMPYIALKWFQSKAKALGFGDSHSGFSVQKFKSPPRIEAGLVIYETWGKTEAKVMNNAVDFGLEITQSGSAIKNYGLQIVEEVMASESSIWASPAVRADAQKHDLARMFLLNLYGSINAEDKVLVVFNAPKEKKGEVCAFLRENHLFLDEPTVTDGEVFAEFTVLLEVTAKKMPLARVRYALAKLGATGIETIPTESSIPSLDVIDF